MSSFLLKGGNMIVIDHPIILDKDTTFDGDVRVSGSIVGGDYILTVKGELICESGIHGKEIIVRELNVSGDVHAGLIVAQKASARDFIGGTLIAEEIVGQTRKMWRVKKIEW
jgi:hypothetical protein